jgi:ectoine hydroxylase-related dioxygenase (phytanoyl-CoA dioxygenase family)
VRPGPNGIEQARAELAHRGFTKLERIFAPSDMTRVETMVDALLHRQRQSPEASWRAAFARTATNEPSHPEVYRPALLNRDLQRTPVFKHCRELASQLLERRAYYLFDHAIYKQPWSDTGVHWHQDQAYLGPTISVRSVHFWIPFQDVDEAGGCLRFVPASHTEDLRPHISAYEAHPHILRAAVPEPVHGVGQPLRLGDVSVHTNFTLHSSGPNRTARTRKAWIIHFGDRPRWFKHLLRAGARVSGRRAHSARDA